MLKQITAEEMAKDVFSIRNFTYAHITISNSVIQNYNNKSSYILFTVSA